MRPMPTDPSPAPSSRRGLLLVVTGLTGLALGLTSIVPPRSDRAVVAVSRLGHGVRLLGRGLSFSFLVLERRIVLPRVAGAAVLESAIDLPLPGGGVAPVAVTLRLEGSGALPLDAAEVRRSGWDAAAGAWLAPRLGLGEDATAGLVTASPLWAEIFGHRAAAVPDFAPRLAPALAPLRLRAVELNPRSTEETVRAAARQELLRLAPRRGRLVVLGLDALDWSLVDELTARGAMPNLARVVARGASAAEDVPPPLISPIVWTTIATGVPPDIHGVLDFLEPAPAGGAPRPISSRARKAPALWEMAAAAGRSSAVIGWWATFPAAAPVGGAVFSDRLTEQLLGLQADVPGLADPPEAAARARKLAVRAADVTPEMLAPILHVTQRELAQAQEGTSGWDEPIGGLAKLWAATLTVERLTASELARGTDVVLAYLEGTDTVGHLFGPFRTPAMPGTDPAVAARFSAVADRYHEAVDAWIGQVVATLGDDDSLVIVSDHGFTWGSDRPRVAAGTHTATAELWHRPQGVFIAAGPAVRRNAVRQRLDILDVAPSILAVAGLPVGAEMPGHVPAWLLAESAPVPPSPIRWTALSPVRPLTSVELPAEAREEELAKLRALGYLAGGAPVPTSAAAPPAGIPIPPVTPGVPTRRFDRAEARRLTNLGTSRASAGDRSAAEESYRQAIAADPGYAAAHYNLSLVLRSSGRIAEADTAFWRAVELGVRERELAVVRLALDYQQRGDPAKAREVFAEGRRRFPDSAPIWLNSGVYLGEQGDLAEARSCLERAVALAPTNPAAHTNLAAACLALGDREAARRALAEAARLRPDDTELKRQLQALQGP
jgi:predicted AlkP superfamily phosphohydrolase/phosphomutase/Flp pilus assembly protein TadD